MPAATPGHEPAAPASPGDVGSRPPPHRVAAPRSEVILAAVLAVSMLALAAGVVALVIAGAGGKDQMVAAPTGPVQTVDVELGDLFVEPDHIEVPAGTHLMVEVTNGGDLVHTLNLEGEAGTGRVQPGQSETADFGVIDADAQAWCTIPGHKEAGMVLTITVGPAEPAATSTTSAPASP